MTKICPKCKQEKSLKEFSRARDRTSGRRSHCKACEKTYRQLEVNKASRLVYGRIYSQSEKGKKTHLLSSKKYRRANPHKVKSKNIVNNAIRDGKIKREPCELCGSIFNIHGHHENYTKPLEIIWLCRRHHVDLHYG